MRNNFQSSASCDVDINQSVADDYSSEPAPYLPRTELQEVLLPLVGVQEHQAAHQVAAVGQVRAAVSQVLLAEGRVQAAVSRVQAAGGEVLAPAGQVRIAEAGLRAAVSPVGQEQVQEGAE